MEDKILMSCVADFLKSWFFWFVVFSIITNISKYIWSKIKREAELKDEYLDFQDYIDWCTDTDEWIEELMLNGYSIEYATANAEKFRAEYFERRGINISDKDLTFKEYKKNRDRLECYINETELIKMVA